MMYRAAFVIALAVAFCAADHSGEHLKFRLTFNQSCANVNGSTSVPSKIVTIDLEDDPTVVQDVMELAANVQDFKFTVTYQGEDTGYTIDSLSGLDNAEDCQWLFFYRAPGDSEDVFQRDAKISSFVVKPNSTVTLSYEQEPIVPPSPSPTPTPSPNPRDSGARPSFSVLNFLAVVVFVLVGAVMVQ